MAPSPTAAAGAPCESVQQLENARCPHSLAPEDRTKVNALRLPWPFHESSVGSLYFTLGVALLLVLGKHVQVHVAEGRLTLAPSEVAMIAAVAVLACYHAFRVAILCFQRARATPLVLVGVAGRVLRFQVLRDAAHRVQFVELDAVRCARGPHVAEVVRTHVSTCGSRIYAANEVDLPRAQALADADAEAAALQQQQQLPEGSGAADDGAAGGAAAAPLPSWAVAMLDPKGAAHTTSATLVGYALSSDALLETSIAQCRAPPVASLLSTPRHIFVRTATSVVMYNRSRQGDIEGRVSSTLIAADENARSIAIEPGRRRVLLALLEEEDCGARICAYAIHHDKAKLLHTANISLDRLSGPATSAVAASSSSSPWSPSPPIALAYTADGQQLIVLRRDALSVCAVDAEGLPDRSAFLASASIGSASSSSSNAAVAMTQWKVSSTATIVAIATHDGAVTLHRLRARSIEHLTTCTPPKVQISTASHAIAIASLREGSHRLVIILLHDAFYAYDCDETGSAARFLTIHRSASMLSSTSLCTTNGKPT